MAGTNQEVYLPELDGSRVGHLRPPTATCAACGKGCGLLCGGGGLRVLLPSNLVSPYSLPFASHW